MSVQIPFDLVANKLYLPVRINDLEPSNFVLDTGAPAWFIDLEHASSLGLPLDDSMDVVVMGASSEANDVTYLLSGLAIGLPGIQLSGETVMTLSLANCNLGYPTIHGIVGGSFLRRFVVEFDFVKQIMTLWEPSTYKYRGSGSVLPIEIRGGLPFIQATLTPFLHEPIEAQFVLDMGSGWAVTLNTPFVKEHNLIDDSSKLLHSILGFGVGATVRGYVGRVKALQLGSYTMRTPVTAFPTSTKGAHVLSSFAGSIGVEILRRFHLILDYPQRRIMLQENTDFDAPYEHDMSGLMLTLAGDNFRIEEVADRSPAAEVGLQIGDLITHVDGRRTVDVDLVELRQSFKQVGNRYLLRVRRGNEQCQVSLVLRRLV